MADNNGITAKNFWVWTKKAEMKNPARSREGEPVWDNYLYTAPKWMLDDGLIQDSADSPREGQTSIFDFI
ncbi:hypothetical protein [Paenibacillus polymyxa]|uniref:hypothetical protein n=1 Tax=Paenibacillus polymyxa TaxID=1406 RepID=UPI000F913EA6|nr:hypothetical protein [Paenibacillus polymyxa]KAE8560231.1 hypothetical protein BJH92_10140 [Paenibacillus polymyxa]MCJ1218414.1 hypothetical protein [Paenibacillus polymyxa]